MPNIAFSTLRKAAQVSIYLKKSLKEKSPQAAGLLSDYLKNDSGFLKKFDQINNPSSQATKYSPASEKILLSVLSEIWNENPLDFIFDIEKNKAEGSIAYIYFARLKSDGRELALKILKPDIENEIYTLTKILKYLPEVAFLKKWNFPFANYKAELSERMLNECDFNNEILNNKLAQSFKGDCPVEYPFIHLQISNRHILCMDKMKGKPLYFLVDQLSVNQKKEIAKKLIQTFFHQILKTGFFQSDWNPGNILYDLDTQSLQMIDFGSWIELNSQEQNALSRLISNNSMDSQSIKNDLIELGFSESHLAKIEPLLPRVIEILIVPLFHNSSVNLNDWNPSQKLNQELGDLKWWFRAAGPTKGVFLIRAFHGLFCHLKAFNIDVDFINSFNAAPLTYSKNSKDLLITPFEATQMHIELTDLNNKPIVSLIFPIHTIHNLKELMGESLCQKVDLCNIDIEDLISKFIDAKGPIGLFLNTETNNKRVRIWMT